MPGYGEGTGAAGQTAAARHLYAIVAPSGAPDGLQLQSDGTLTGQTAGTMNSGGGQTAAIDPSGTLLYETAVTAPQIIGPTIPGGVWAFVIDPATGSVTSDSGSPTGSERSRIDSMKLYIAVFVSLMRRKASSRFVLLP